jgi:hypothetical protein
VYDLRRAETEAEARHGAQVEGARLLEERSVARGMSSQHVCGICVRHSQAEEAVAPPLRWPEGEMVRQSPSFIAGMKAGAIFTLPAIDWRFDWRLWIVVSKLTSSPSAAAPASRHRPPHVLLLVSCRDY